jgi:hypothetical protein
MYYLIHKDKINHKLLNEIKLKFMFDRITIDINNVKNYSEILRI